MKVWQDRDGNIWTAPGRQSTGRSPGRPAKPDSERKRSTIFSVHPADLEFLHDLGEGNRSLGLLRAVQTLKAQKAAALAAIKAAAERRDQTTVKESAFD